MKQSTLPLSIALEDYQLEGFFNFDGLSVYVKGFFTKFGAVVSSTSLLPEALLMTDVDKATKKINATSRVVMSDYEIYAPEYLDKDMTGYLTVLSEVFTELSTIEKDLLTPLYMWLAGIYSNPDDASKIWINLPSAHTKVDLHTDRLHQFFNDTSGDSLHRRPFYDIFKDGAEFFSCSDQLKNLTNASMSVVTGTLLKKVKQIADLVDKVNTAENQKGLQDLPTEKVKLLADVVYRAAREMELLALVMFQIKVSSQAYNETVKKINNDL
jgi:hypothetical protein